METAFGLGANLGDRPAQIAEAIRRLLAVPGTRWMGTSSLHETAPVDVAPEHAHLRFLNAVLLVDSPLDPEDWLAHALRIERELGRVRDGRVNAPRPVDIDVLYCGDRRVDHAALRLPHPRLHLRRFVLAPLAELRPDLVLAATGRTVRDTLAALPPDA